MALLQAAAAAGCDYLDIPLELEDPVPVPKGVARIHSWHQEEPGTCDLDAIQSALRKRADPNDLWKIVTWAEHAEDAWPTLDLYQNHPDGLLAFAQGPGGTASRLLSLREGAPWIYCGWPGESTAPGQLSLLDVEFALPPNLGRQTPVLGVVGHPIGHSLSPFLWRHADQSLGVEGEDLLYLTFPVADFPRFLEGAERHKIRGLSVTAPWKQEAFLAAAETSAVAEACQAANLLVSREEGSGASGEFSWSAYHTDGQGAMDALTHVGLEATDSILLLGAGGAAQAVAAEAQQRGHDVAVASRKKPTLRPEGFDWLALNDVDPSAFDAVVQATPVGSIHLPGLLCEGRPPRSGALALDMVYHPPVTAWMRQAKAAGADVLPGTAMLVRQMVAQYRCVFPDHPTPDALALQDALAVHLQERAPLVLVGARASGKSTLARLLAQSLGRTCLDADDLLARRHQRPLSEWIATDEAGFREAEAALLPELLATSEAVIATGGGVVTLPQSVHLLQDAPRVVFLDCPTEVLWQRQKQAPRPSLREGNLKTEIEQLLTERLPAYRAVADLVISANESPSSEVMKILQHFGLKGIA